VTLIEDSSHNYVLIAEGNFLHMQAGFTGFASLKLAVFSHAATSTEQSASDLLPAKRLSNEAGIRWRRAGPLLEVGASEDC
jgi:hypothetical protein